MASRLYFILVSAFAIPLLSLGQNKLEDTTRAGSGGSAGTTQQGPVYDAGILGPNSTMGTPDLTAVDPLGFIRRRPVQRKPVGTIRLGIEELTQPDALPAGTP